MIIAPSLRGPAAFLALTGLLSVATAPGLFAAGNRQATSQIYVTHLQGEALIDTGDLIEGLTPRSVYSAEGAVIETRENAENSMVFSNGTGVFFSPETRLEVRRFVQEPFSPVRNDLEIEPSISQALINLHRGSVGLCTSRQVAGSSMVYSTPHASVNIRGNRVVIEASEFETKISLIEGDVTVRAGENDAGGQTLQNGQQAIIRREPGQPPLFMIQPIPANESAALEQKVAMACLARRTVYFDVVDQGEAAGSAFDDVAGQQAIEPIEVIPSRPPVEFTVSTSTVPSPDQ